MKQTLISFHFPAILPRLTVVLLMCGLSANAHAQLYPGLEGESLADAIREDYKPTVLLTEADVRDSLYGRVFLLNDSVRCIYSGMARFLPEGEDPSVYLYNDGNGVESMNLEHGWPRSKGAGDGTDGNLNMYHLFPSRTAINSDRAAHPFGDINDNQTTKWYYQTNVMTSIPSGNRDVYSEYINGEFEPRESMKGDIARAMFYFWTIYRDEAVAADPAYFSGQLDDLCQWHQADPADEEEMNRNALIAEFQGGVDNPFITDCSLVMRAYCPDLPECELVAIKPVEATGYALQCFAPEGRFRVLGPESRTWQVTVFDLAGRKLMSTSLMTDEMSEPLSFPSGVYVVSMQSGSILLTEMLSVLPH